MRVPSIFQGLSRARRRAITDSSREVSAALRELIRDSERDFLAVGGKLEAVVGHAKAAAELFSNLLLSLAGEESAALSGVLDEVMAWASEMHDAGARGAALSDLGPVVSAVRGPVQQLRSAARMLRVAGVVTRVESARLGDHAAGFVSLADEVARLADDIEGKSDSVLAAVEGLRHLIGQTGETVLVSERRQNEQLLHLLAECRAALDELHAGQERLCALSVRAQAGYERIVQQVGQMVMALQFHDSTRQRLEHVDEALSNLCRQLEGPDADAGLVAGVVELQAAQIGEARICFMDSMTRIRAELSAVQVASADLAGAARELSDATAAGGSGSGSSGHFSAVAFTIDQWCQSRRSLALAAEEVSTGCGRVGAFVGEIQEVGTRLLRLALNAQVEAVRLAGSGAVMEAVAEGIRGVSQEASAYAQEAGEALLKAEVGVAGFARELGAGDGAAQGSAQAAAAHIESIGARMEESAGKTAGLLRAVVEKGDGLSAQIAGLTASLTADALMDNVAERCLAALARITSAIPTKPATVQRTPSKELAAAAELYTMQHERDVHAALTGGVESVAQPESNMGGDIELF